MLKQIVENYYNYSIKLLYIIQVSEIKLVINHIISSKYFGRSKGLQLESATVVLVVLFKHG